MERAHPCSPGAGWKPALHFQDSFYGNNLPEVAKPFSQAQIGRDGSYWL